MDVHYGSVHDKKRSGVVAKWRLKLGVESERSSRRDLGLRHCASRKRQKMRVEMIGMT